MDLMEDSKAQVSELNPYLLCSLCSGYMIDASTIVECLHSFCRSCIYKYLESSKYCPICDVQIHKTKPYLNIKSDKTLQTLIYKLVPNLLKNELQRRQDFFDKHPDTDVSSLSIILPTEHHHIVDRYKFLRSLRDQSNWISLCVRPTTCFRRASIGESLESCFEEASMVRYFFCPPEVKVFHLKKLLIEKFELDDGVQVDIFHAEKSLADFSTLSKVTEIYDWDKKNPFELDYSIKILPQNSSANKAENDTSKLQALKAFRARLQARMREIQLKSKYLKPNKRKLRVLQSGVCLESPAVIKKKKMKLGFGRGNVISEKNSPSLSRKQLRDDPTSPPPELASLSTSSGLAPSSELTHPLYSNVPPVLEPDTLRSSRSNEGLRDSSDGAGKPSSPSSLQLRVPSCAVQSLSGTSVSRKSSEECIITEVYVPHKKTTASPESKKNRNIFDLVRPLLNASIFDRPLHSTSKSSSIASSAFVNSTSKLVSSVASAKESFFPGNGVFTPINVLSSSSSDSSLICNSDVASVVDNTVSKDDDVAVPSSLSKESSSATLTQSIAPSSEGMECCDPIVKIACNVDKEVSQAVCGENDSRNHLRETAQDVTNNRPTVDGATACENLKIGRIATDGPKNVCRNDGPDVPGDPSPVPTAVDSDLRLPKKSFSSCSIEGRSTFFEKFSKDLEFHLEDITSNPKVFNTITSTPKVFNITHLNENVAAEMNKSNVKSSNKISNPETLNQLCQDSDGRRPTKRVKQTAQGKKVGFEASCKESHAPVIPLGNVPLTDDGTDDLESNLLETDEPLSSSSRSYKISKREMCGLVMDMSKKYLKEFPANGFAFASTLSDEGRHLGSGHQRRSKQKSMSS